MLTFSIAYAHSRSGDMPIAALWYALLTDTGLAAYLIHSAFA